MYIDGKKKFNILKFSIAFLLIFAIFGIDSRAALDRAQNKKAIVFIMDEVSLEDIASSKTPNLDRLIENGSVGLMNSRPGTGTASRGSRFLSLGMGVRTVSSTKGGWAFGRDEKAAISDYELSYGDISAEELYRVNTGKSPEKAEILNVAIGDISRKGYESTPNNKVGLLGDLAKANNISIGLVGNSDTNKPLRESTLIGMDHEGTIPRGYIEKDLLVEDKDVLGGKKINQSFLLEKVDAIIDETDLLFIDFGDTVLVEDSKSIAMDSVREDQKQKAVERGDQLIGEILERVDLEQTMFMLISPNPSKDMIKAGNFGLTPTVLSGDGVASGILTSSTTRRDGLVTNFDFAPTLLRYLGVEDTGDLIGEGMSTVDSQEKMSLLEEDYSDFLYLRKFRSVFHWAYIALVVLSLILLFLPRFTKYKNVPKGIVNSLSTTVFSIPIMMLALVKIGYRNIFLDIVFVFLGGFILSNLLNKILKKPMRTIMSLGFLTTAVLLIDTFFINEIMITSPLGSDAIAGGRFYGLGNDYMGILLGSTILSLFILGENKKIDKRLFLALVFLILSIIIVGLSPFVGANMGGTLSAMVALFLSIITILDRKISIKKLLIVMVVVLAGILLVAGIDILFNPNPTHAGKAIKALLTGGGFNKLYEIISIKLRQVFWNLAYASWNIVLFGEIVLGILLFKFKKDDILNLKERYKYIFKGFIIILLTSLAVFAFNDTGTIAAALVLIYLFIPLGIFLNEEESL